ncbi:hypothetical protein NDU88_002349 [Pleurodeles waltl]|uniref:Uncharacterized protein n=1 Tax=Pleurodeles waltl TaxID=8319 RepID=A0AAV7WKY7_PLEWA|nr:hypothetical protein NDU88_002349 [Pleurodeles waltl]
MAELRSRFRALDARYDTVESRFDKIKGRLDIQDTRIQGPEDRISNLDDGAYKMEKRLERMENRLRMVAAKNEDVEACQDKYTATFVAERGHRTLGSHLTKEKGPLQYQDMSVTSRLRCRRHGAITHRQKYNRASLVSDIGVRYGTLYLTRLWVDVYDKMRILESPSNDLDLCKTLAKRNAKGPGGGHRGLPPDIQNSTSMDMFAEE